MLTADQGTPTITKTSTVTVRDTGAKYGYTLSAKLPANTANSIPGATVTIYPTTVPTAPAISHCTQASSCTLPVDNGTGTTPSATILSSLGNTISNPNSATTTSGATTDWTITITLPTSTPQGNYLVDIEYAEEPYTPPCPVLQGKTYMQDVTTPINSIYGNDTRVVLKDRRNNQDYYVQNIVNEDGSCTAWMETNLRYAGGGNNTYGDVKTLSFVSSGFATYTDAEYTDPGGSTTLDTTTPTNNTTFYGYLYNWCAALGGQENACNDTSFDGISDSYSICPAGWRLPTGDRYRASDFVDLIAAVGGGYSAASFAILRDNFLPVYSGYTDSSLEDQGVRGYYWSSTPNYMDQDGGSAHPFIVDPSPTASSHSGIGTYQKYMTMAVRCVL